MIHDSGWVLCYIMQMSMHPSIHASIHPSLPSFQFLTWVVFVWIFLKLCICILILGRNDLGLFTFISYGPWLMSEFHFFSISWEQINRFWSNFIYTLKLIRSGLEFKMGQGFIFQQNYDSFWHWIQFLLNIYFCLISWEWIDGFWSGFVYTLILIT